MRLIEESSHREGARAELLVRGLQPLSLSIIKLFDVLPTLCESTAPELVRLGAFDESERGLDGVCYPVQQVKFGHGNLAIARAGEGFCDGGKIDGTNHGVVYLGRLLKVVAQKFKIVEVLEGETLRTPYGLLSLQCTIASGEARWDVDRNDANQHGGRQLEPCQRIAGSGGGLNDDRPVHGSPFGWRKA